ncbi:MAG TPA: LSM domain-containing protein [Thermoplasmata archaeon]|nr:LSM domain-containing protein [Thermoplasmata archaeon]
MSAPPATVLERLVSQRVALRLKDSRRIEGRLVAVDEHLNMVIEETEEATATVRRRLGRVILRGSNVASLHSVGGVPPGAG